MLNKFALIISLYIVLAACKSHAADGDFVWAKQIGGAGGQDGISIATDTAGNIYTVGYFSGIVDFDPGLGSFYLDSADSPFFLQKINVNGEFLWAKTLGAISSLTDRYLALDSEGNIYIIGSFSGTSDFDPSIFSYNLTSSGGFDISICKLDSDGNFIWAKQIGNSGDDFATSIAIDTMGDVVITGYFQGTVDFDPDAGVYNITSIGEEIYILKLDETGGLIWVKTFISTGGGNGPATSITTDNYNNVISTGYFNGTKDFDPGPGTFTLTSTTANFRDTYVSKLDSDGNFIWAKLIGGPRDVKSSSIAIDEAGGIYSLGLFEDTADFDPGISSHNLTSWGGIDVFVMKLSSEGNFEWAGQMGGLEPDYANSIAVDSIGNVVITGRFMGIADFDPGSGFFILYAIEENDMFVVKLNTFGEFMWASGIGGAEGDVGNSICVDDENSIYVTGVFSSFVDFDSGPNQFYLGAYSAPDCFVLKLLGDSTGSICNLVNMSIHSADKNSNNIVELTELLRVVQLFNLSEFSCDCLSEDGYKPGISERDSCAPHSGDYNPLNWSFSLVELLRIVQFFNIGGYSYCPGVGEDGFCPGQLE